MEKNKQTLAAAYEEYSDGIFRYCLFQLSDREKALECVSETFARAWHHLQKGGEIENMKMFLYTTARTVTVDEYKESQLVPLNLSGEYYVDTEESLLISLDADCVMECVKQLPEVYSSIITMRYVNDLSLQDISHIVNEPEHVISGKLHRGLHTLRMLTPAHQKSYYINEHNTNTV